MAFSLLIEQGDLAGRRYVFDQPEVSFGRTDENDVVVPNDAASRRHARIVPQADGYQIEDLRSSNGTRVNGEPLLRPLLLEEGDVIEVGKVHFRFAPYEAANSTRIVALGEIPQWEKHRAKVPERPTALQGTPGNPLSQVGRRFNALPPLRRNLIVIAVVLTVGFLAIQRARRHPGAAAEGPETVEGLVRLGNQPDPHTYGVAAPGGVDRSAPHGISFSFNFSEPVPGKSLLTLHLQVTAIRHADDVDLLLNGQHLMFLPATFDDQRSLDAALDRTQLQPNAENTLQFKPQPRPNQSWVVSGVWVEQESLPTGSPEQLFADAKEQYTLGEDKFNNQSVAAQNLYDAWHHYKRARLTLAALAKGQEGLANLVSERLRDVENALDKRCRTMQFTAQQQLRTKGRGAAAQVAEEMLKYFPQNDHPCFEKAHQLISQLE